MSARTLRVLRRAETDQADTLYGEEAKVIEEAERLLGSGLQGDEAGNHYT